MNSQVKKVDELNHMNRSFAILKDSHGYWAIETKFIKNGVISKKYNGITGLLSKTAESAKERALNIIEIDFICKCYPEKSRIEVTTTYFKHKFNNNSDPINL